MSRLGLLAVLLGSLAAPGCAEDVSCGEGSHEVDGTCVAEVDVICGEGTFLASGTCLLESGAVTCSAGSVDQPTEADPEKRECVATSTAIVANATRWTDIRLSLPPATSGVANANLPPSYMSGDSLIVEQWVPAGPGKVRLVGGGGSRNESVDQGYETPSSTPDLTTNLLYDLATMESEPGVFYVAILGPNYARLEKAVVTNVLHAPNADGVEMVTKFHVRGLLTKPNAHMIVVDAIGGPLDEFIEGTQDPFDADIDGDGTLDAWIMEGDVTLGEEVWAF